MKEKFNIWILENNKRITKPSKYSGTISTISNHFRKHLDKNINLYDISDHTELINIRDEYFAHNQFHERNLKGNRMYSRSLDLYIKFLQMSKDNLSYFEREIEKITNNKDLTKTTREALILSRVGQGKYRDDLIKIWKSCAISKFDDTRLLIASHIKPWIECDDHEKIDKYNGLLLLPTYDKLFDLGLISFEDSGKIIISEQLNTFEVLGVSDKIIIEVKDENKKYLNHHRDKVLKVAP